MLKLEIFERNVLGRRWKVNLISIFNVTFDLTNFLKYILVVLQFRLWNWIRLSSQNTHKEPKGQAFQQSSGKKNIEFIFKLKSDPFCITNLNFRTNCKQVLLILFRQTTHLQRYRSQPSRPRISLHFSRHKTQFQISINCNQTSSRVHPLHQNQIIIGCTPY